MSILGAAALGVGLQAASGAINSASGGIFAGWRMRQQRKVQKQLMDYQAGIQDRQATTAYNRQVEQWQREADWNSVSAKMSRAAQAGLSPLAGLDSSAGAQQGAASAISSGPGGPSNPGVSQPSGSMSVAGLDPLSITRMRNESDMAAAQSNYYNALAYKIRGYEQEQSEALTKMYNSEALSNQSRTALNNWQLAYNKATEADNREKVRAEAQAALKQLDILAEKLTQEVYYSTTLQPQEYENLRASYAQILAQTAVLYADEKLKSAMAALSAAQREQVLAEAARTMLQNKELENLLPISEERGKHASESVKLELRQKRHAAFRDLMIGIREGTGSAKDIFDIIMGALTRGASRAGATSAPSPTTYHPTPYDNSGLGKVVSFGSGTTPPLP